jgi:CubicO group peptidase (beta-lactamase class C family)
VLNHDGRDLSVASGGAHWGDGLFISARDLALIGQLYLRRGRWNDEQIIDASWIDDSWRPCPWNPNYGYLWWLNDGQRLFPSAPTTGRCAQGNRGQHILWVDPARDLVVAAHWSPISAHLWESFQPRSPSEGRFGAWTAVRRHLRQRQRVSRADIEL